MIGLTAAAPGNDLVGGVDLLRLLVLALGGALAVGNVLALLRPPVERPVGTDQEPIVRPPVGRSVTMIAVGLIAAIWALASLTS